MSKVEALYKNKNPAWVNDSSSESVCELPGSESTNSFLQGKERLSDKRINVGNLLDL